jgi:hypothetical protein
VIANSELTNPWKDNQTYKNYITKWTRCKTVARQSESLYKSAEENLNKAQAEYDKYTKELETFTKEKRALNL